MEQLQAEARCIVQHPGFEETGRLTPSAFFLLLNITMFTALRWFPFFPLFYTLFASIVNVNAAKSGTVLDNLSVNMYTYIYIYIYIYIYTKLHFGS